MQTLQNKTLVALENNTIVLKILDSQRQNSFLDEQASLLSATIDPPLNLKNDRGEIFTVDTDVIDILLIMGNQSNKH